MDQANVIDQITHIAKYYQWIQKRTVNALNECHRYINVNSDLGNGITTKDMPLANMIMHENYKFVKTISRGEILMLSDKPI